MTTPEAEGNPARELLASRQPDEIFDWMEVRRDAGDIPSFLIGVEVLDQRGAMEVPDLQGFLKDLGRKPEVWQGVFDSLTEAEDKGSTEEVQRGLRVAELLGVGEVAEVAGYIGDLRKKYSQPVAVPEAEDGERNRLLEEAERKLTEEARELGADDPMAAFNLWQSESQPVPSRESPESRRGNQAWWQMTQAEFLEKYPDPNIPPAQRAAFALLHRMMLEDALLTYREPEDWYGERNRIPEEVIARYPDLQEQYEQAKAQVFEQPYEPLPQLSEEAKTKLENIFRQLNEATGEDGYAKRQKLSEEAEDQITAILNRPNVRVPLSGIHRRLHNLPFSLDDAFYSGDFKLAQKIFGQATPDLRQVFAIGQEAVRVYDDSSPKYQATGALNHLITRASGVNWAKEKEAVSRGRLSSSLRDNFYLGLTGKSYNGYLLDGPVADRKTPELEVLVQNFQGMNSAGVAYFQLANSIAQARENYLANLADRAGLKFIPTDTHGRWSLVEKIPHREIPRLVQGKTGHLKEVFTKLEATERQANDFSLPRQAIDRARGDAERLKLQLAKVLGLSGDERPATEKTRQEMRIPTFTSWENLEWFMQPGQADYSDRLFAKAPPQIQEAFNKARNAYSADAEEGGYYSAQSALIDLIKKEIGIEDTERELEEKQRQRAAYEGYFNKVLLPRFSTVPDDDLVGAFIDANILDNRSLRLRHDIDQRLNGYFYRLAKEAGLSLGFAEPKRKGFFRR